MSVSVCILQINNQCIKLQKKMDKRQIKENEIIQIANMWKSIKFCC